MYPESLLRRRKFDLPPNLGLTPARHPMDERLPDGSSVDDLLRKVQGRDTSVSRPVTVPPNAGLSLPRSATPSINISGIEPPQPSQPIESTPTSPRIGYSTSGLQGVDRLMQRRRALEEADPESKVTDTGEILPPEKTGRLRGLGQGIGLAAAQADPDRPMYALGQLLGGGISGVISPRSSAKGVRKFELSQLDNDIARGLKLKQAQVELDRATNPIGQMSTRVITEGEYPGIEAGTEIRVRVDPRTGSITDVVGPNNRPVVADLAKRPPTGSPHYESDADGYLITVQGGKAERVTDPSGQPVKVKSKNSDGEVVEVEVNGQRLKVTPGQALNYYGQVGERAAKRDEEQREREARYSTAKSEYDSLVAAEAEAGKAKDAAYKTLDDMRRSGQPKEDVDAAQRAAAEADQFYRSFAEKKKDAARRMGENRVSSSSSSSSNNPPAPPNVTESSIRADARARGKDEEAAVRKARLFGWIP